MASKASEPTTVVVTRTRLLEGTGAITCERPGMKVILIPEDASIAEGLRDASTMLIRQRDDSGD